MAAVAAISFPTRKDELRAKAEWPFECSLIYLDSVVIDDTYQRPEQTAFVKFLIENFDETLVGTISVSLRPKKGLLACIDGQQRFLAMRAKGKTSCYAAVYTGMTIPDEAGFFYRLNRDRKSMNVYYGFRARRVAGDPQAIDITALVENSGFVLGPNTNENEVIGAIRAVEIAYLMPSEIRDDCLTPALNTIRESVFGRKRSVDAYMIQTLARFWSKYEDSEVNNKILNDMLAEFGPAGLLGIARDKQRSGVSRDSLPVSAAKFLVASYNTRTRGTDLPKLKAALLD